MIIWRIFLESFKFAWHALRVNKLRTVLSLLGVTIGILTMVAVFATFDSLERSIRNSVQDLGNDVLYLQKWPWGGGGGEWWKYWQRPEPTFAEAQDLQRRLRSAQAVAFSHSMQQTAKYRGNSVENVSVNSVSQQYQDIWNYELAEGRYFHPLESQRGSPVAVLGSDVAEGLYGSVGRAVGQEVKMMGRKLSVIGVIKKQGQSLVGQDMDGSAMVPIQFTKGLITGRMSGSVILIQGAPDVELAQLRDEVEGVMRSVRRLRPRAENDFALNEISVITNNLDSLFSVIGIAGLVIGGFSILVGGFGIANIMFVSVRERTNQIGIQMSLGAKGYFILLQFLAEAVMLCLLGGLVGIGLVAGILPLLSDQWSFAIELSPANILQGLLISVIIGVVAGFVPALMASRLNPVEAIRRGG